METTFWDRLQGLLGIHRITQAELSKELDLSPSYISASIGRGASPRADFAYKVAKYFGVSLKWLISGEDEDAIDAKFAVAIKNDRIMEIAYLLTKCPENVVAMIENFVAYAASNQKTFGK
ncbi:helix-turn-helix domain-containing protein [Sphaerochaeta globosa]|uniref:Helix-turn-helix domain protein n=1 Tax=Sphaerochaeta globosa (strain ATCC BAA-1886 / DSM 22777 / Buddy) TaxID=158189 RepID=F0RWN3_SPHGB|nr:helix-turn-helix transcriptional regulator [Sphaerochaeta globosa]ADY13664.1 helix-turn-helix domain protein [Sphaerochaeta globosa str. Buddy]